jgi:4-phospho-D-threonate 3-dehydrogenase / 4-phospho-D-erythronate 3-dehydrogenase
MHPIIAISIGDIYGIGPEVIFKAFTRSDLFTICRPVIYGPMAVMQWYKKKIGTLVDIRTVSDPSEADDNMLSLVDTGGHFDESLIGTSCAAGGATAVDAIRMAYEAVTRGNASALVTAPISKEAIALAGSPFRGHTDMLASFSDSASEVIMILSSNTMKVGLVTIHVPLHRVAPLITRDRIMHTLRSAAHALERDFAIRQSRIAVLALNPHAGDGGYLGAEENDVIIPAIAEAQAEGISVDGPFPADGFFSAHNKQFYDMIVAMYHDQGLVPFKMNAAGRGVNISCGLPIVRTSPDHGTAYNIAGLGVASAESMKEAIVVARTIVVNRSRIAAHTGA